MTYSVKELEKKLNLSKNIIWYRIRKYKIEVLKINKKYLIDEKDIKKIKNAKKESKSKINKILLEKSYLIDPKKKYSTKEMSELLNTNPKKFTMWRNYYAKLLFRKRNIRNS